jgi:putative flavoprotein involved in K+ transport
LTGAAGERLAFADDLEVSLERADSFFDERFRRLIDTYIERAGIEAPPDDRIAVSFQPRGPAELNLLREGVSTVIWATGYALDYPWIAAPVIDELGYPRHHRVAAAVPGLYFLGLLWQHSQASASLVGPDLDAPYLVDVMGRQAARRSRRARRLGAVVRWDVPPPA